MKSLEALRISTTKIIVRASLDIYADVYRDIFTGRPSSQLIIRGELARIIRSDTASALSAIAAGLSAAKLLF